jgi:hypothetical protein
MFEGRAMTRRKEGAQPRGRLSAFCAFAHGAGQSRRPRTVLGETGGATENQTIRISAISPVDRAVQGKAVHFNVSYCRLPMGILPESACSP